MTGVLLWLRVHQVIAAAAVLAAVGAAGKWWAARVLASEFILERSAVAPIQLLCAAVAAMLVLAVIPYRCGAPEFTAPRRLHLWTAGGMWVLSVAAAAVLSWIVSGAPAHTAFTAGRTFAGMVGGGLVAASVQPRAGWVGVVTLLTLTYTAPRDAEGSVSVLGWGFAGVDAGSMPTLVAGLLLLTGLVAVGVRTVATRYGAA